MLPIIAWRKLEPLREPNLRRVTVMEFSGPGNDQVDDDYTTVYDEDTRSVASEKSEAAVEEKTATKRSAPKSARTDSTHEEEEEALNYLGKFLGGAMPPMPPRPPANVSNGAPMPGIYGDSNWAGFAEAVIFISCFILKIKVILNKAKQGLRVDKYGRMYVAPKDSKSNTDKEKNKSDDKNATDKPASK